MSWGRVCSGQMEGTGVVAGGSLLSVLGGGEEVEEDESGLPGEVQAMETFAQQFIFAPQLR